MADISRTETFQYPAAHYGHLDDSQQKQLEAFRQLCLEQGYYTPADAASNQEASHDDETLLRFLRARRFNPQDAFAQFKDTEEWRREHSIDNLYKTIDIEEFEQTRRLYPQWLGRRDKRGIPVYLFEVAPLNTKNTSAYEKMLAKSTMTSSKVPTKSLRLFALYESLTGFVQPLCSAMARKHPETPISQSNNIVDIGGVGLKQFWNLKGHMQDASQLATAHYPETLDRIFIIGAPAFFPTVWGWIKRWFDPITVSKIFILSAADVFPTLSQYMDPDNIPKKYGGNLDFQWGDMPHLEPEIESAIKWVNPEIQYGRNTVPIGPMKWEKNEDGSMTAIAIGSENGQPRQRTIFTIPSPVNAKPKHVPNTPVDEAELALTTVGTATQPQDPDPATVDLEPSPLDTPTASETPKSESQASQPLALPIREGTSNGDKIVAQAPNDVSADQKEAATPGYVDKTKHAVAQASEAASETFGSAVRTVAAVAVESNAHPQGKVEAKVPEKGAEQNGGETKIDGK